MTQAVLGRGSSFGRAPWNGSSVSRTLSAYRKLLDISTNELERRTIFKLLAEEQEKFRQSREAV